MKYLNKEATKVMDKLTEGLDEENHSRKIDNFPGSWMAVNVDRVSEMDAGVIFAVAHNFIQEGDVMADPDMGFLRATDPQGKNLYFPTHYQLDSMGLYQESAVFEDGKLKGICRRMQSEHTTFANMWMKNIKVQQQLKL